MLRVTMIVAVMLAALLGACAGPAGPAAPESATDGGGQRVTAAQVAERLMAALRDEDYASAHADLSTGQARDYADSPADLEAKIATLGGPVTAYELEAPRVGGIAEDGKTLVEGSVTMSDGSTRALLIRMAAIGLLTDPWRIDDFDL
jgi:hypothetical protein